MNCIDCGHTIRKEDGYYLVGKVPYCTGCFPRVDFHSEMNRMRRQPVETGSTDDLLEAFRKYQARDRSVTARAY